MIAEETIRGTNGASLRTASPGTPSDDVAWLVRCIVATISKWIRTFMNALKATVARVREASSNAANRLSGTIHKVISVRAADRQQTAVDAERAREAARVQRSLEEAIYLYLEQACRSNDMSVPCEDVPEGIRAQLRGLAAQLWQACQSLRERIGLLQARRSTLVESLRAEWTASKPTSMTLGIALFVSGFVLCLGMETAVTWSIFVTIFGPGLMPAASTVMVAITLCAFSHLYWDASKATTDPTSREQRRRRLVWLLLLVLACGALSIVRALASDLADVQFGMAYWLMLATGFLILLSLITATLVSGNLMYAGREHVANALRIQFLQRDLATTERALKCLDLGITREIRGWAPQVRQFIQSVSLRKEA